MACAPTWLPAQPYADEDDLLCECSDIDFDSPTWEWAKLAASRRVFDLTFGAFPGMMTSKIRPCRKFCTTNAERIAQERVLNQSRLPPALPFVIDDSPAPVLVNLWACDCALDPCSCGTHRDAIVLPYRPVCEVTEVLVDGEVFTAWQLVGARLYRTDGLPWPTCQGDGPDTEPGTWSVTFTHGGTIPPEGAPLVAEYACQLAKRACRKPCDLPDGIRVISRPGAEYAVVDYGHRDALLTGFTPLDDWLVSLLGGANRAREAPRIWTRRQSQRRAAHRLESQTATPIAALTSDGILRETLHPRSNQALYKTVTYPGRVIEGGRLTINDPDGNEFLTELADIVEGTAVFNIAADSWPDPFPADGSVGAWDMIVKIVGGDWEVVAEGPARFHVGVSEPVF